MLSFFCKQSVISIPIDEEPGVYKSLDSGLGLRDIANNLKIYASVILEGEGHDLGNEGPNFKEGLEPD